MVLDVESFVDYFIVTELMRNFDGFDRSFFIHKPKGGRITYGPVWDFDLSAVIPKSINPVWGALSDARGVNEWQTTKYRLPYLAPEQNPLPAELLEHPEMLAHTLSRMKYLKTQMPQIVNFVASSGLLLAESRARDLALWGNNDDDRTYVQSVQTLENWLEQRSTWMINEMEAGRFR